MIEAKSPYYPRIYRNVHPYSSQSSYHGNSFRPLYTTFRYFTPSTAPTSSLRSTSASTTPPPTTIIPTISNGNTQLDDGSFNNEVVIDFPEIRNPSEESSLKIDVGNKTNICGDETNFRAGSCIESTLNDDEIYIEEVEDSTHNRDSKHDNASNEGEDSQDDTDIEETTHGDKSEVVEAIERRM